MLGETEKKTSMPISTYADALIPNNQLPRHNSFSTTESGIHHFGSGLRKLPDWGGKRPKKSVSIASDGYFFELRNNCDGVNDLRSEI